MGGRVNPPRRTLVFLTCLLAVPTVSHLIYGAPDMSDISAMAPYLMVGAALGLLHLILRPLLRLISAPLGCLTLGLSGTAIDVALIYLSARVVEGFPAPEPLCAILTALLINAISTIVGGKK